MAETTRMTVAQAIVKFLDNQYVSMDGVETKFVEGFFTIFGHGIAVGLGEALDTNPGQLRVMQGRNEQGMCHVATAFAKQNKIGRAQQQKNHYSMCFFCRTWSSKYGNRMCNSDGKQHSAVSISGRYLRFQTAGPGTSAVRAEQ